MDSNCNSQLDELLATLQVISIAARSALSSSQKKADLEDDASQRNGIKCDFVYIATNNDEHARVLRCERGENGF